MKPPKTGFGKKKSTILPTKYSASLVETTGPILITVTLLPSMHGALPAERGPHSFGINKKAPHISVLCFFLVEITGIEPVTSCMPCKRSPS